MQGWCFDDFPLQHVILNGRSLVNLSQTETNITTFDVEVDTDHPSILQVEDVAGNVLKYIIDPEDVIMSMQYRFVRFASAEPDTENGASGSIDNVLRDALLMHQQGASNSAARLLADVKESPRVIPWCMPWRIISMKRKRWLLMIVCES